MRCRRVLVSITAVWRSLRVKSMRKMISIAASMVLYPKPLAWQYAGGLVSTIAGLGWMYAIKRRKLLAAGGSVEATK